MTNQYNLYAVPNNYFDGGYDMVLGAGSINGAKADYEAAINNCGARTPWDIDMTLTAEWGSGSDMQIDLAVTNNAGSTYNGYVRLFVIEKVASISTWKDGFNDPYTMVFLAFGVNEAVSIGAGATQTWSFVWDGANYDDGHGNTFDFITPDNTMVIAGAYEGTGYPKYSYPPNTAPYTAYYLDESIGVEPTGDFPDIEIVSFTAPSQADEGENVYGQIDLSITNDGDDDALDFYCGVYISEDDVITTDDTLLTDGRAHVASLPMGATQTVAFPTTMSIPTGMMLGDYYIGVIVDDGSDVYELDEENNVLEYPFQLGFPPVPDIKVNDDDGPLTVTTSDNVEVRIGLDPGDLDNVKCDWWCYVQKDGNNTWWAQYTPGKVKWEKSTLSRAFAVAKLRYVGSFRVLKPRTLPQGNYIWTFSVDDGWDVIKDDDYMDQVELTVIP